LSPFGERVQVRVGGLRSAAASDLQFAVTTRDPAGAGGTITRLGTDVRFELPDGGLPVVSAFVPGNTFPERAVLVVTDAIAGESTRVENAFYRPDVALALPGQGPTTGGSLLTLIGTALVPYDFDSGSATPVLAFDDVELSFAKGGRVTVLPRADLRIAESSSDRLVFTVPPAPDGRPGQVDIVLQVKVGDVTAAVTASQVFLFANPDPFFGPRGVVLDRLPVAIAPIALDQAPSTAGAPDFAALTDQGGVGFVQLLLAQQNGMFQAFAAPRQIGDHENAAERLPRDLGVGDFDGDQVPDLFVVNEGAATAIHHLVLGQAAPQAPLGAVFEVAAAGGSWMGRAARFDSDSLPDVLLVPGPAAPPGSKPQVLLARPLGAGQPAFAPPIDVPVRDFPFEAVEVADLDGDGNLDVAVVSGTQGKLDVAYGFGDGTFAAAVPLDFAVPGYTFDAASPAIGLHACRDGALQSLGLVLAGVAVVAPQPTTPTVAVLPQSSARVYAPPEPDAIFSLAIPGLVNGPFGRSLVADLDGTPPIEMVVAIAGEAEVLSLGLLQLDPTAGFEPITGTLEGAVFSGAESPRQIRALAFDRAFPATQSGAKAVFLVHETEVDGARERRLSTRLVLPSATEPPRLLPPDAGDRIDYRIDNVVAGNFHPISIAGQGAVRDLALARRLDSGPADAIQLIANDGFGGLARLGNLVQVAGLLPGSITLLPAPAGVVDGLLFADGTSRLGFWRHVPTSPTLPPAVQPLDAQTAELRALLAPPMAATDLAESTAMRIGDVDGDGVVDLVVLLSFALANPGEGQAAIGLLRGKASPAPGEFPFHFPQALTPVHGNASALELGDFTDNGAGQPRRLELAVAVPAGSAAGLDGDHVRFFRYQPGAAPADDRFVASAKVGGPQVLLAGSAPTRLAADDFDGDGVADLLVACRGDGTLRLFRNTAAVQAGATAVDVGAFEQALGSPWLLAAGMPSALRLADVNGDGNLDAVAFVEFTSGVTSLRSTTIGIYLRSGPGTFDGPRYVSPTRIGNRDGHLSGDIGDWNRDGLPDLLLGWDNTVPLINLRVLFGGTR
ncbi:MAG: FG-GAP-like repeat-containing protein, partial [Planctomycetota bacterium]